MGNISGERMAEGEDKDTPGEGGARGAPVSAGPCSLLAWPLGNLASLLTGVPLLPEGTQFRPPPAKPFGGPLDHVRTCLGSIRSFLLAYLAVFYIQVQTFQNLSETANLAASASRRFL